MTTITAHDRFAGTRWLVDGDTSTAEFRARHFWGLVTVKGHFTRINGQLAVDHDDGCEFELTLDAASLDTGNLRRDARLRSADFFDAADHPVVRFASTRVSDAAYGWLHTSRASSKPPAPAYRWSSSPPSPTTATNSSSPPSPPSTSASSA